ncbi:hypothetical protein ILUMI_16280 [Ignelater luminosus]|uniref:PiggyBac transposable element-derived protein domain-containing protein n=1 Tax=Ignelater luminosus TaxID=2038154 RepID=A0A8K0CSK6_IGNLU|nr:hypothetical protein ILUMI_16280 [Ignelater luminosus]
MCANNYLWVNEDLDLRCSRFPASDYSHLVNKTIVEMFELFIDDEVVHYLVEQSQRYAEFTNCPNPNISFGEFRNAIAILILVVVDISDNRKIENIKNMEAESGEVANENLESAWEDMTDKFIPLAFEKDGRFKRVF